MKEKLKNDRMYRATFIMKYICKSRGIVEMMDPTHNNITLYYICQKESVEDAFREIYKCIFEYCSEFSHKQYDSVCERYIADFVEIKKIDKDEIYYEKDKLVTVLPEVQF